MVNHESSKKKEEWVKLFKKQFKFTGGEIANEFLMSSGFLPRFALLSLFLVFS
jgi:DNA-3-methyladenine glycosylase I